MLGKKFNEKCDIYSYGIILWYVAGLCFLFFQANCDQTRAFCSPHKFQRYWDMSCWFTMEEFRRCVCRYNERPRIPEDTPANIAQLIKECWDGDYTKRPSFKDIVISLNEILLSLSVTNEEARQFWKTHFLDPKQVLCRQSWLTHQGTTRDSCLDRVSSKTAANTGL